MDYGEKDIQYGGDTMSSMAGDQTSKAGRGQIVDVRCAFCRGEGQVRSGATCQVCGGKGYRRLRYPTAPCAICHGTGRVEKTSSLTCVACDGLGAVEADADAVPCPDCGGSGRAVDCPDYPWPDSPLGCVRCLGSGVIDRGKLKPGESPPSARNRSGGGRRAAGTGVRQVTLEY